MIKKETGSRRFRRFARAYASRAIKNTARRLGYDLVDRRHYSPVPDLAELPEATWTCESELRGLDLDVSRARDFLRTELSPYLAEYAPPRQPTGNPRDFYLENAYYESVDAEVLYAMVRRFVPLRTIELGSGMSTLVIADARANDDPERGSTHRVYDPYPRPELVGTIRQAADLRVSSATDIPLAEFDELGPGDILFVDTTHTVKVGGDVNRIILDVLPGLKPGVLIHFHDVFLPWEYRADFLERGFFWNEQYLLQAFLAFNSQFEVLLPLHALQRRFPEDVAALVPSARHGAQPSAFWLRRIEGRAETTRAPASSR